MKLATRGLSVLAAVAALAIGGATATASAAPATASKSTVASTAVTPSTVSKSTYVHHKTVRQCGAAKARHMTCFAIRQTDTTEPAGFKVQAVVPNATPSGYGPTNLQRLQAVQHRRRGQTVAIVDAYDDPNAASDLAAYRTQYGLPACTTANGCFSKVNQTGATSPLPATDTGWAGEISLDVDMVSAICPNCHILLVEANSRDRPPTSAPRSTPPCTLGAKFVSNSYGGAEDRRPRPATTRSYFNHPGVAITASTGDSGYGVEYPAASPVRHRGRRHLADHAPATPAAGRETVVDHGRRLRLLGLRCAKPAFQAA